MAPIRILQMIGSLGVGGSQNMIINLHKYIDKNIIQFDYILDHYGPQHEYYVNSVESLGGKVFFMPNLANSSLFEIIKAWKKFFKQHPEYKVLHSHVRSYAILYLFIAKHFGLKTIIHSHSTNNGSGLKSFVKRLLQYPLRFVADYFFACSDEAGKWLFGKNIVNKPNYKVLPNAIDVEAYAFSSAVRKEYRNKLGIADNTKVFIHAGRFHFAKNHKFLLDVFSEINKQNNDTLLILVGDGDLRLEIEKQISNLNLQNQVKLLGVRNDVNCLLQAADCFLFPSLWEGMPVTLVEAQASGIKCLVSDKVTKYANVSEAVTNLPIDSVSDWIQEIQKVDLTRRFSTDCVKKSVFNIEQTSNWLSNFYEEISK